MTGSRPAVAESAAESATESATAAGSAKSSAAGSATASDLRATWGRIRERQQTLGTHLCVGLDPVAERLPAGQSLLEFCLAIIESTAPFACAFKPNSAFFEAEGLTGWTALFKVIRYAQDLGVPVILDAKRGDIGSTAALYAKAAFDALGADGLTVSPYLGQEAITPILEYNRDALTFVLCATSNPHAEVVQADLFLRIAKMVQSLSEQHSNVGLVVGATRSETMTAIRRSAPGLPWLVPGIGAQGGDLALVAELAEPDCVFNASRHVLYASRGADFHRAAASAARELRDAFNRHRTGR
ncbi:MAG: orotidine-5'-phosphate decarboxylase [Candidatus Sericytochromatia bacterium]|uniref:Orotidine-5'-phosphate decarboxylase n=1 Tax=Candidatus Tanganyikabacteria bacterium TaxID=2961651 RepID=A0A937X7G1_9BACT|nr:orotidine-5'-phosphate decarboxylase [Candidatus Tanganyikabacteria bacterium]